MIDDEIVKEFNIAVARVRDLPFTDRLSAMVKIDAQLHVIHELTARCGWMFRPELFDTVFEKPKEIQDVAHSLSGSLDHIYSAWLFAYGLMKKRGIQLFDGDDPEKHKEIA